MSDSHPDNPNTSISDSISNAHTHTHSHADRGASPPLPFDLERAFTHPAGLRVARQLARSLIEQRPIFGSSSEVMAQLRGIMEMSDDYPATATPRQTPGAGATSGMDLITPLRSSPLRSSPPLLSPYIPPDGFYEYSSRLQTDIDDSSSKFCQRLYYDLPPWRKHRSTLLGTIRPSSSSSIKPTSILCVLILLFHKPPDSSTDPTNSRPEHVLNTKW